MSFIDKIKECWSSKNSLLCVGLDPDINKIPEHLKESDHPILEFTRLIVDATHDLVCAYKPQIAYFSAFRAEDELEMTIKYIHDSYPDIPVILDAKRGDIGSTAEMYSLEAFDRYKADAVTINPYLGGDTLRPFLDKKEKGIILLCRTSNPGAKDIQDIESNGEKLYRIIAKRAAEEWNYNGNIMLVMGATYPEELKDIRRITGDIPFLVPGIGAQGGDVKKAVKNGITSDKTGMVINSSRGIIYAGSGKNFTDAARRAAIQLRDEINKYRV
ncbi:orotidine-5'-phosphate decarboxylase [Thermodesulfobacteriota bacterium]